MHRSKTFMYNLGEDILKGMEKMDKNITPTQLTMLASMADDYNKLCKFIEKHSKYDDKAMTGNPEKSSYFGG